MTLTALVAGNRAVISDVNQLVNLLTGVAASGATITLIYNAAASVVLQPSSDPAAGTEAVQIKNNAGTVQGSLTYDGKVKVADGTAALPGLRFQSEATGWALAAASTPVLSIAGTEQLRVTSSAITIAAAASRIVPGATSFSHRNNANSADNLLISDAGVVTVRSTLTVTGASLEVGTTPATAGAVRLANNTNVDWRNAANGANIAGIYVDTIDVLHLGFGAASVTVDSPGRMILAGTLTAGGLVTNGLQVASSGPLVYSGSGAPSISAAVKGSLYLRSDGTTTNDRAYIATNTSGTWTALTTVA